MSRIGRARRIRQIILAKAKLSLRGSFTLKDKARTVTRPGWRARIARTRLDYNSTPDIEAIKLDLWVEGEKVAIMAWTKDGFWVPKMVRGNWETLHFKQPPYRTAHQRWVEACSKTPVDPSVLALMRMSDLGKASLQQRRCMKPPAEPAGLEVAGA